ncbi:MAG: alpha-L-fucosidase [Bacteroidales bacterium]|nr:alpha-L-fucosidase [Bacteroidales bacterium]
MKKSFLFILLISLLWGCGSRYESDSYIQINPEDTPEEIILKAAHVVPSARQLEWQDLEFTAFCHFGINTFTNREWGDGTEDPALFNPTEFDARQWVSAFKDAGLKMVLITAKHHDGFCLWPSAYTDHSVKSSPWMDGKGDVVKAVKEACDEFGLKFGVYLSPWDRNQQVYGSDEYNTYFVNQLTELLSNYGVIDEVWFDGACGEGPNGKRQVYDWMRYYETIRELQPDATIAVMGPDVRWVGTESGYGRVMEWSVVPYNSMNTDETAENSQQAPTDGVFIPMGDMMVKDLGSRNKIRKAKALVWYPSEVDVSIRPGWFYHTSQDDQVKTPEKLFDIWFSSIGRNSLLLLNIPPDTRGLIHENDVKALKDLASLRETVFGNNLAEGASVKATSKAIGKSSANVLIPGREKFWMAKKGEDEADLEFDLGEEKAFDCITISENIELGQRVEQFSIDVWKDDRWREITRSTTIGNKRILRFSPRTAQKVRLRILQARYTPAISFFALHKRPPQLELLPAGGAFMEEMAVELKSDMDDHDIYYTLDGSEPDKSSLKYSAPVTISESAQIRAIAYDSRGASSFIRTGTYTKATFSITYKYPPSPKYQGNSQIVLMDGQNGSSDFSSGDWLGWEGVDMVTTIDFGEVKEFKRVTANFVNAVGSWIFLPRGMKVEYSTDGKRFKKMGELTNPVLWDEAPETDRQAFSVYRSTKAKFIRVTGVSIKTCPDKHAGEGGKAWLFCDEITVE